MNLPLNINMPIMCFPPTFFVQQRNQNTFSFVFYQTSIPFNDVMIQTFMSTHPTLRQADNRKGIIMASAEIQITQAEIF
jgi:hypothetical protein